MLGTRDTLVRSGRTPRDMKCSHACNHHLRREVALRRHLLELGYKRTTELRAASWTSCRRPPPRAPAPSSPWASSASPARPPAPRSPPPRPRGGQGGGRPGQAVHRGRARRRVGGVGRLGEGRGVDRGGGAERRVGARTGTWEGWTPLFARGGRRG